MWSFDLALLNSPSFVDYQERRMLSTKFFSNVVHDMKLLGKDSKENNEICE
jgi:hypothetical protein